MIVRTCLNCRWSTTYDEARCRFCDTLFLSKDTNKKARLELLPPNAIEEVSRVLELGAKKYGKLSRQDTTEISHTHMIGKALRHITAHLKGHDTDPEIGTQHIAHAATDLLILLELILVNSGKDDR